MAREEVIFVPTEMLTRDEHRVVEERPLVARRPGPDEFRMAARRYASRVRRLKLTAAVWGVWTILITTLWVAHACDVNDAFERFGYEGDPGHWNPTLWALGIGVPTLIVGIMALGVYFVRPTADPAVLRIQRLRFHVAAWLYGMVVLTPLWALTAASRLTSAPAPTWPSLNLTAPGARGHRVSFAVTIALVATYVRVEQVDVAAIFRRRWRWSLGLGVLLAVFLVFNVLNAEDATERSARRLLCLRAALARRRLRRGRHAAADSLPLLRRLQAPARPGRRLRGKLRFTALTLPPVIIVTATYHWGYTQYREDGLGRPETGNVLISIPVATANPVGSVVAHVSQHVAAVTHAYESEIFNPPVTKS